MCNLSEAIEEKGITQGIDQIIHVLIETCQEFGSTKEDTIQRLIQKFKLSLESATSYVELYWK